MFRATWRPTPDRASLTCLVSFTLAFLQPSAAGAGEGPANSEVRQTENRWWSDTADRALSQAGTNRLELIQALKSVPLHQRGGLQFLLENMPPPDLQTLPAGFLLEHLALACQAMTEAPWAGQIPADVFLNDILPYASVNERRDAWRKTLHDLCAPLVKDCQTPGEAAKRLNQELFGIVKVKYSTQRKRADQSPLETMESGVATCTGLSILLVDACRSVGVPARVAGTPLWVNLRGNHTWVEVWDQGWHFTGAAEQDPNGLDRGWFTHDASQAQKDAPRHAIYASSFKKTGLGFPLVWAPGVDYVSAVNVTDRYTAKSPPADSSRTRLLVEVLDRPAGKRVRAKVRVTDAGNPAATFEGTSKGETADTNDILAFDLPRGRAFQIDVQLGEWKVHNEHYSGTNAQDLLVICLNSEPLRAAASQTCYVSPAVDRPLGARQQARLQSALVEYFGATADKQPAWKFPASLEKLLKQDEPAVRRAAWETYRNAPIHDALKRDYDLGQVRSQNYFSPYTVKTVGVRPAAGWALFVAMHGGGGAPKEVNDSQWRVMQRYYRDHPEAGGYLYLALRAPNDTWNGFYADYVYPLVANLIRQFLLFGDVDPNKVFIMGYSHGGYGAFAIGPKMPDRFAAIHSSAAAPTDGETSPKTLRNTLFAFMVGENDHDYGRLERCQRFDQAIRQLRGDRTDIYPVSMQFEAGYAHGGLPDRDEIKDMYPAVRNPVPRELTWAMTDTVIQDFFWLRVPSPAKNREIDATCRDNRVVVKTVNVTGASLLLDSRLIDFRRPVTIETNGHAVTRKLAPSLLTLCRTLIERGDPELAFSAQVKLDL